MRASTHTHTRAHTRLPTPCLSKSYRRQSPQNHVRKDRGSQEVNDWKLSLFTEGKSISNLSEKCPVYIGLPTFLPFLELEDSEWSLTYHFPLLHNCTLVTKIQPSFLEQHNMMGAILFLSIGDLGFLRTWGSLYVSTFFFYSDIEKLSYTSLEWFLVL